MLAGVNYPWLDYGWDFGLGPPAWRGDRMEPRWLGRIDDDLSRLYHLGVRIIRWFVLADGLTYGTGSQAPYAQVDSRAWRFAPPPLGSDVLDHFARLLARFAAFNATGQQPIQLLPVLIDFHFCHRGAPVSTIEASTPDGSIADFGWVKQGRAEAITDAAQRRMFLDLALDPLLEASQQNAETIYAWELINEPDWITNGWHPDRRRTHPIDADAMQDFLSAGVERIRSAGFKATVGFAMLETLLASGVTADLHQFHHYPGGARVLPADPFGADSPAILGEFATSPTDIWPELGLEDQSVLNRLVRTQAQGYAAALAWSFLADDRYTSWSRAVERDVLAFTTEWNQQERR
jgi:hypothetical protein